jgi:hypothetical protein
MLPDLFQTSNADYVAAFAQSEAATPKQTRVEATARSMPQPQSVERTIQTFRIPIKHSAESSEKAMPCDNRPYHTQSTKPTLAGIKSDMAISQQL